MEPLAKVAGSQVKQWRGEGGWRSTSKLACPRKIQVQSSYQQHSILFKLGLWLVAQKISEEAQEMIIARC
jgi:hypothetical protein